MPRALAGSDPAGFDRESEAHLGAAELAGIEAVVAAMRPGTPVEVTGYETTARRGGSRQR